MTKIINCNRSLIETIMIKTQFVSELYFDISFCFVAEILLYTCFNQNGIMINSLKVVCQNYLWKWSKNTNPWQFLFVGIVLTFMEIVCLLLLILFYVYVLLIDIIEKITTIKVLRVRTVWFLKLSAKRRLYNVDNFTHL